MSVSDIEEEMREIYEIELSTSAISIITNKVNQGCSGITEPPFGSGLSHRLDGWYCIQGSWQRKNHQQDCLSLCRFETERLERSPWHVGGKIRKFFILDGCPDRFEGPRSAGHIDYLHWQPERVYRQSYVPYFLCLPRKYVLYIRSGTPVNMSFTRTRKSLQPIWRASITRPTGGCCRGTG